MTNSNSRRIFHGGFTLSTVFTLISLLLPVYGLAKSDPNPAIDPATLADFSADECKSELATRLALISIHAGDPLLENNLELANRCGNQMVEVYKQLTESTSAQRMRGETVGPINGLINFETPHVHPIDLTPDGNTLLSVNTAAHRLDVWQISGTTLNAITSIPVGIDPVSVRARNNSEVWVVNQISDSVSIVNLDTQTVVQTLQTDNEPADVVFAGPNRAFVTASEANTVNVFDLTNLSAPPQNITIQGEDPRALAVSADGQTVFAAVFESGNGTRHNGSGFSGNGSIVRDNLQPDNDVAIIDANALTVSYRRRLMNMVMAISVQPITEEVFVVGTEAFNDIANEPALNGKFIRVFMAGFTGPGLSGASLTDMNPHLDYSSPTLPAAQKQLSIGDPRGIAWTANGLEAFVTGMGSNNIVIIDSAGNRIDTIEVGEGPTGIVLNTATGLGYVMNKFSGTISVIDLATRIEVSVQTFDDPTPAVVKNGRRILYDTHFTSGTGHTSCASCHVDGRTDRLGWQLSDGLGTLSTVPRASNSLPGNVIGTDTISSNKHVMTTQTLLDIMEHPRFHWRGDRETIDDFNGTFVSLMGRQNQISVADMNDFKAFLETLWLPPNPYRNLDNSRPQTVTLPDGSTATSNRIGSNTVDALRGGGNSNNCLMCHMGQGNATRNFGANREIDSNIIAPALPALYDKMGFTFNRSGFGFFHHGGADLFEATRTRQFLAEILTLEGPEGPLVGNEVRQAPHAGMGRQLTIGSTPGQSELSQLDQLISIANSSNWAELIAHARINNRQRGFALASGELFDTDIPSTTATRSDLLTIAANGDTVTFTLVASGMSTRLALDSDLDGVLNNEGNPDSCLPPTIDPAVDRALFVWQDCDDKINVIGSGGNNDASYQGLIVSDQPVNDLNTLSVELSDNITINPATQVNFSISLGGAFIDEFNFSSAGEMCFALTGQSVGTAVLVGENRVVVTPPFNPVTLESCTLPDDPPEECDPSINPIIDEGIFVWQDCQDTWNLQMTGLNAAGSVSSTGSITSVAGISNVTGQTLEPSDLLNTSDSNQATFSLVTSNPWEDRFTFDAVDSGDLCIDIPSSSAGLSLFAGVDRTPVSSPFNPITLSSCSPLISDCAAPVFDAGSERALFSWIDCEGKLHLLGTGAAAAANYTGHLYSDSGFTSVTGVSIESSDEVIEISEGVVSFDLTMGGVWIDEVIATPATAANLCVAISQRSAGTSLLAGANRVPVSSPFNPLTLEPCTPPTQENCGDPLVDPVIEEGFFIWKDCNNAWTVLFTGALAGGGVDFTGTITSSTGFTAITPQTLEPSDVLTTDLTTPITFAVSTGNPWDDSFSFRTTSAADLCVTITDMPDSLQRFAGPQRTTVGFSFNPVTFGSCN
ncbi:MAG: beta-propeller fold lactonase family protein [Granulosicoccus sp.]|nr:beta-propeller fold lactonase family protein [Granulosicoccus sp.]